VIALEDVEFPERIRRVTREELNAAIKVHLHRAS
jgi:hypothetical protein